MLANDHYGGDFRHSFLPTKEFERNEDRQV